MEAVIYDDFDLCSPFNLEEPLEFISPSQVADASDFESVVSSPPSSPAHTDVLPIDAYTRDMVYSFGIKYFHEADLRSSRFGRFTRQSRLRFAPRRISHQMNPPTSPAKSLLGTNPCRSYVNISLVQQVLKELKMHAENLEDHLFLLGLVLRQLSKERWYLGNHIGLLRSLLVTFEKRLDSMLQAPPDSAWPPCNVQITDITFEFHTDSQMYPELPSCTIRFPLFQSSSLSSTLANELLAAGKYPSTEEVYNIQEMLDVVEPTYRMINLNICALESIIDNLEMQLQTAHHHITLHSALLAPVNNCPLEVILEIFRHCLLLEDVNPFNTALALGAVSSLWRQAIISIPWAWATINIQLNVRTFSPFLAGVLAMWIKRAGAKRPLSLRITFTSKQDDTNWLAAEFNRNRYTSLLGILCQNALRWRNLEFVRCPFILLHAFSDILENNTPNLQSLVIDGLGPSEQAHNTFPYWYLPKGCHLSLLNENFLSVHMSNIFDLPNLRSLTLVDANIINHNQVLLFEFLTSCTSLEICKLRYSGPFGRSTNGTQLLRTLPSLLDLSLAMESPDTLLKWMILPRLRRLNLTLVGRAFYSNDLRFVQEMFDRSHLIHLSGSFDSSPDDVHNFEARPLTI